MDLLKSIVQIFVAALVIVSLTSSIVLFVRLRWPAAALWGIKLLVSALSPFFLMIGLTSVAFGLFTGLALITMAGACNVVVFLVHLLLVTRPPQHAFGSGSKAAIETEIRGSFLRSLAGLGVPHIGSPRFVQNIVFATVPGADRKLLCDVWEPSPEVTRSGLAFIYLHGSAFFFLDKDCGTRPFFTHLVSQGHVIMDVAYRLFPETDIMGMVNDVNRAVAWMKDNAHSYGVNPDRIVLGGGSAGGHLALLTACTNGDSRFLPKELEGKDTRVCAVISLYGTSDLKALYYHTNQHLTTRVIPGRPRKAVPTRMPKWMIKGIGKDSHRLGFDKGFENAGALAPLLGGHPDECPEAYELLSPITHVHPGCPPTLLVHGEHDIMAPVESTRLLHSRLIAAGVPTVMHILPQTDHAFDLLLPKISPSAHTSLYDVQHFLSLLNVEERTGKLKASEHREFQFD